MVTAPHAVVARIITRLNVGGPARQALALSKQLVDFRTVLAAGRPTASEGELSDPEIPVRYVPLVRPVSPRTDLAAFAALRRVLRDERPAIVHTHTAKAGALGRLAALTVSSRPRIVHTFHGHVLDGYFSAPVQRAFIEAERQLARVTDVLLAISPLVRDSLLDLGIGRADQFRVVPLGIDLTPYVARQRHDGRLRAELGLPHDASLVGMVGRLVPIKDGATMIEAVSAAPDVHLVIVGDGEARPDLERLAEGRGIRGRVHFTGWRSDVAEIMADLDVVALSSRNEGTPVALIEGLASGVPVVATRVGGVPDVVDEGVTGFLVPPDDAGALSRAMVRLLDEPALRRRFGDEGRLRMIARYSLTRLLGDIGEIYDEMIGAGRPRASVPSC